MLPIFGNKLSFYQCAQPTVAQRKRWDTSKNVSSEPMRKLERSCSPSFVILSQKWVIYFWLGQISRYVRCLLIAAYWRMCECVGYGSRRAAAGPFLAIKSPPPPSTWIPIAPAATWRSLQQPDASQEREGGFERKQEAAVPACLPACQPPGLPACPSRTTCGLHSPPPGPAPANPSASELSSPAAAPLSSVAHTHCLIRTLGLPKLVWTCLTLFDTCILGFLVVKNVC
jgi:hypothetical protein